MARPVDVRGRERRRAAIVRAAGPLFAAHGFEGTSTARIAREAGVSNGSLFYHFPDKRALFRAVFADDGPAYRRMFAEQAGADPVAALLAVVDELAKPATWEEASGLAVELMRQAPTDPELVRVVMANDEIVADGLTGLLRRAAAAGRADPALDPAAAARWIRVMIDGLFLNDADAEALALLRLTVRRLLRLDDDTNGEH